MAEVQTCSHCGAELPAGSPGGHCVRCILQFGLNKVPSPDETVVTAKPAIGNKEPPESHGCFDRYRLLEELGEGGSGVVYRAEQLEPVRREVALKVIKLGMDTQSVKARFVAERQALALMDHPNIAQVLDAGASDTGRPFFVMELVRGVRITDYCDRHQLSTGERLKLFIQVCLAVQHAHQKGVIHRDLKPSNVLVTEQSGLPVPKVIDFGIAKATGQQHLTDKTLFTAFEQFLGTPAYMSPEQAGFGGQDVDTRSDIYSLGVLLYELLTGKPPFDPDRLRHAAVDEVFRLIREEEPPRPSARLTALTPDELLTTAHARGAEPERLSGVLSCDVDWIVMKALEKDRTRRYETANGLATDLKRYLRHEAVIARPPSTWYRLRKLARRNQAALFVGVAILALLMVGLGISFCLYSWEVKARQLAEAAERTAKTESAKSQQIAGFLEDMLQGVQPSVAMGRDTTLLREVLSHTTARVSTALTNQPEVQAEICAVLGSTYGQLGDYTNAVALEQQALRLRRSVFGDENLLVADSLLATVDALAEVGRSNETEPLAREAVEIYRRQLGPANQRFGNALGILARSLVWEGRSTEAEPLERQALAILEKRHGKTNLLVANHLDVLANILATQPSRLAEAEDLMRQCVDIYRQFHPDGSLQLAAPLKDLGNVMNPRGNPAGAEAAWNESLTIRRKFLQENHPVMLGLKAQVQSSIELWSRDPMMVCREIKEAWAIVDPHRPLAEAEASRMQVRILLLLGMLELNHGNTNQADHLFRESLSLAKSLPLNGWGYYLPQVHLGYYMEARGQHEEAEAYFKEAANLRRNAKGGDPACLAHTYLPIAYNQICQGKPDEADHSIHGAWAIFETMPPGNEQGGGPMLESPRALVFLSQKTSDQARSKEYLQMSVRLATRLSTTNHAALMQPIDELNVILIEQLRKAEAEGDVQRSVHLEQQSLPGVPEKDKQ